jgi:hypothetical protein
MSYGPNILDLFRRLPSLLIRSGGTKPADIRSSSRQNSTCRQPDYRYAIGLIPSQHSRRADEVI